MRFYIFPKRKRKDTENTFKKSCGKYFENLKILSKIYSDIFPELFWRTFFEAVSHISKMTREKWKKKPKKIMRDFCSKIWKFRLKKVFFIFFRELFSKRFKIFPKQKKNIFKGFARIFFFENSKKKNNLKPFSFFFGKLFSRHFVRHISKMEYKKQEEDL